MLARSRLKIWFPEWFLPSKTILKCKKDQEREDMDALFQAELKAYERLKPLQGMTIPRLYGTARYEGQDALLLQHLPGPTLADPEGATMTLDEVTSYSSTPELLFKHDAAGCNTRGPIATQLPLGNQPASHHECRPGTYCP